MLCGLEKEVVAAFSTRKFYPAFKEDLDFMAQERKRFLAQLKLDIEDLVCPNQIHETEIFEAFASDRGKGAFFRDETLEDTDALITAERRLILSVLTADCISLFLYDSNKMAIGLAHIGWRGLAKGMVEVAIRKMHESFGTESVDLITAIGPAIRGCCYGVSPVRELTSLENSFIAGRADGSIKPPADFSNGVKEPVSNVFKNYLIKRENSNFLDLPEIVKEQLKTLGVDEQNIIDCGICTACSNDSFFSFRKEQEEADRMMSILSLK